MCLDYIDTGCPKPSVANDHYSQGAQVVHLGAAQIPASVASRVAAVVSTTTAPPPCGKR